MKKRILIVDDDAELAEEIAEILRDEGYFVDSATDSGRGEALIGKNIYDAYLFDYKMSGLTGTDLLRKAKEKDPKAAVLIISGRPFIEKLLKEEKMDHLVSSVIKKPFDAETLLDKIKDLVA